MLFYFFCDGALGKSLSGLGMVWVAGKGFLESFPGSIDVVYFATLHGDKTKLIVSVCVRVIMLDARLEVLPRRLLVTLVVQGRSQVEVALGRVRLALEGHLIRIDGVVVLAQHVVGISKVVESRRVVRVLLDGGLVHGDCLSKLFNDTVGVAQVVIGLGLFGIEGNGTFVVLNSLICLLEHV